MGSPFMVVRQLFLAWTVLDGCVIVIPKVPQSSFMLFIQWFLGLPLRLILCTSRSSAIFGYLLSFILIIWKSFFMSSLLSLSLRVKPRIFLRHTMANTSSHSSVSLSRTQSCIGDNSRRMFGILLLLLCFLLTKPFLVPGMQLSLSLPTSRCLKYFLPLN